MIFISNLFVLPLLVIIWSADAWLWLATIRLLLGKITSANNSFYNALRCLADPLPEYVRHITTKWSSKSLPYWMPWLMCFIGLMILRYALLEIIIVSQN